MHTDPDPGSQAIMQSKHIQVDECKFDLNPMVLRAKRWRSNEESSLTCEADNKNVTPKRASKRVIALHGWLDNAASFDFLMPGLLQANVMQAGSAQTSGTHEERVNLDETFSDNPDQNSDKIHSYSTHGYDILALDLAGHGLSDQRPGLGAYNIWQDVLEVILVANMLGWETFSLLGHSRGAMICSVLAGCFPSRVDGLVMIEALCPQTIPEADLPSQLASSIESLVKLPNKKRNYYNSFEKAVNMRVKGFFPLPYDAAEALAKRGVSKTEKGYYWNSDSRLLAPSEIKFSDAQVYAFVDRFPVKAKVIIASSGLLNTPEVLAGRAFSHRLIEAIHYDGDHHLHLSADVKLRETMANDINEYYENTFKK